jgi:tetratricopeptide (TPR) repeat protein
VVYLQGQPATVVHSMITPLLALLAETGDRWAEGWALLLWANNLSENRPLEAEEVYARGDAVCRASGDRNNLGYTNQMRSGINLRLGRPAQARLYIDEAIAAFEEMGNVLGLGYATLRRGQLLTFVGDYGRAIHSLRQALAHFEEVKTQHNVVWTQTMLGHAYRLEGDSAQAEQFYRQVLAATTHPTHRADSLSGLGRLAHAQGDLQQAERLQREALALYAQVESEVPMVGVYGCLGEVMLAAGGRRTEGRQTLRRALELAIRHHLAPVALELCIGVARLLLQSGDAEQASKLLALVEQHEASTFDARMKAGDSLVQMTEQYALERREADSSQQQTLDLWTTVKTLLPWLATATA